MRRPRHLRLLGAAGFAAAMLLAPGADAATYCVNKSPCPNGGSAAASLTAALATAEGTAEEDTVYVGANGGTPYAVTDNFDYNSPNVVHVIGDGIGQTKLQGSGSADINSRSTLRLLGSSGSTVSDMTITGPSDLGGGERALTWRGTASRVEVVQNGAPNGAAAEPRTNATFEDGSITGDVRAISPAGTVALTVRDSRITSTNSAGVSVSGAGSSLNMERTAVTAAGRTVEVSGAGTAAAVTNVVLRKTTSSPSFGIATALGGTTFTLRHATMIGAGGGRGFDIDNLPNATATLRDSIIVNVAVPVFCASSDDAQPSTMTVAYSNFGPGSDVSDPGCNETLSNIDSTTVPAFVDAAAGDYRLIGGSPLIDAADPADPIGNDFLNVMRPVGGRSDMGAYEYRARPPSASITAPSTAKPGEAVSLTASGTDEDGDPLTYAWDFGDGATAAGATTSHAFAAGTYDVTLTVTDSAGLSSTSTARIGVAAAKLTGLEAKPRRIKARKSKPKLVPGGKRGLVFELTQEAEVTLTLERCKGKRGCAKTRRVKGSARFGAPEGRSAIAFAGSLDGRKKLRRGRYVVTLTPAGGSGVSTKLKIS